MHEKVDIDFCNRFTGYHCGGLFSYGISAHIRIDASAGYVQYGHHIWPHGQHRPSGWQYGAYKLCAAYHPSYNIAAYGAYHRDDDPHNNTHNSIGTP